MYFDDERPQRQGKYLAVFCADPIDLRLTTGILSLRYVAGQWVHLCVSAADEAILRSNTRLRVKSRPTPLETA